MDKKDFDDKVKKLERAIASPATPKAQKESFEKILAKLKATEAELTRGAKKEESPNLKSGVTKKFKKGQGTKTKASEHKSLTPYPEFKQAVILYLAETEEMTEGDASGIIDAQESEVKKMYDEGFTTAGVVKTLSKKAKKAFENRGKKAKGKKAPVSKQEPNYNCDDLIDKEKERAQKRKVAAAKRAAEPKKTPATKNKVAIENVAERLTKNIDKRIEKGQVNKAELEKLVKTTEELLTSLKARLKKL